MTTIHRDDVSNSLREFKRRRDALLHGDNTEMELHLRRFVEFCDDDSFTQLALQQFPARNSQDWWEKLHTEWYRNGVEVWQFPKDRTGEMGLRYALMKDIVEGRQHLFDFGDCMGVFDRDEQRQRFVSLIVHPFCDALSDDLRDLANIPSEDVRALQAVPLYRLPGQNETRIFLSHKSTDKELVRRYAHTLKELGFAPWLDESDMPAGTNLDRGIVKGFKESCAAVFFVTENFKDERFIEDEINYAKMEKRDKGDKFAVITLRFNTSIAIPDLLRPYVYFDVYQELDGLYEIIRALPIELGGVRWKERVVSRD